MSVGNVNFELESGSVGMGIRKVKQTVLYSDLTDSGTTGSLELTDTIPEGAFVIGSKVTIKTGFTGGANTTAVVTVGATAGEDDWSDATNMSVLAADVLGEESEVDLEYQSSAAAVHVRVTVDGDYTTIDAGEMVVEVFYLSTVLELP